MDNGDSVTNGSSGPARVAGSPAQTAKEYALCAAGSLLVAVGVYFFKFPNNFSTGGVSGLSIILGNYFGLASAGTVTTVLNLLLLLLGFIFVGRDCGGKTILGTAVLSGSLMLLEKICPLSGPLTDQPLLELIFAVLLPAVGSAILFNCDGSTGGTDIAAMILKKHTDINISTALLISDVGITCGSFLFGIKVGLFSVLGLILKTLVIDSVIENINLCKCLMIVTDSPDEISRYITGSLGRSCTVLDGTGAYSHSHKYMLVTVMRRYQAVRLQKHIRQRYPESFVIVTNSSGVIGKGFRGTN